jgi:hypothetical protein
MRSSREQRAAERKSVHRDALLSIPRLRGFYSCGVRNLSDGGAGLRLNDLPLLAIDFHISLDGFRTTLACQLIWRDGHLAGIAFRPAAIGSQAQLSASRESNPG